MLPADRRTSDAGGILVEYVLVSILVVAIVLGVFQLALTLHVRNLMVSAAAEGARLAAANDRGLADGADRTATLLEQTLQGQAGQVTARDVTIGGAPAVEITVTRPVPVLGLWGAGSVTVSARAFEEAYRG